MGGAKERAGGAGKGPHGLGWAAHSIPREGLRQAGQAPVPARHAAATGAEGRSQSPSHPGATAQRSAAQHNAVRRRDAPAARDR